VETLLHAEYYEHLDLESGGIVPACDQYHVPKEIQHHIDYITPGVKLMGKATAQFSGTDPALSKRMRQRLPRPPLRRHLHRSPHKWQPTANLSICDEEITPACLAALYQYPQGQSSYLSAEISTRA
jgi:tripeptidyl-peptidase I